MKEFSASWISSKNPRKKRKYLFKAPLHLRRVLASSNLSETLRRKYKRRSFPVRKGDTVKIVRGQFRKKTGKVQDVNRKKVRVYVDCAFQLKKDGSKSFYPIHPSNLQITELNLDDKKRRKALERNIKNVPS